MPWVNTSVSAKTFPKASWDELAELEKASPGLTRLPPSKLVSTTEIESIRRSLLSSEIVSMALAEARVGRKKRGIVLRKIADMDTKKFRLGHSSNKPMKHELIPTEKKKGTLYAKA